MWCDEWLLQGHDTREDAARHVQHRAAVEVPSELLHVERGGGDDKFQVLLVSQSIQSSQVSFTNTN
jgi:hypothetical protein